MLNTTGLLKSLYNFNGSVLVSVSFKHQDEDLVVVHFERDREPFRQDLRLPLKEALQLHDRLEAQGCRKSLMVTPVMCDVDAIVSVFGTSDVVR